MKDETNFIVAGGSDLGAEPDLAEAVESGTLGVYFQILHGRDTQDQDMPDWGYAGPLFGPFQSLHTTYASDVRCATAADDGIDFVVNSNGLLEYDGKYYGDWESYVGYIGKDGVVRSLNPGAPKEITAR